MNRLLRVTTLGIFVVASALGCSTQRAPSASTARSPEVQIPIDTSASPGAVPISVTVGQLTSDRQAAFGKLDGPTRLVAAVRDEMVKQHRVPAPPVQLALTVTNFRIRSTATSLWFGAMAGADILDVETTAATHDQVLNRWKTGSASIIGGLVRPDMEGRFERLISTTAQRIVAGL